MWSFVRRLCNPAFTLGAGIVMVLPPPASAQVSFYGAPAPSNLGGSPAAGEVNPEGGPGMGLGIFGRKPFIMTLAVRQGYDSNVYTSPDNPESSMYTNIGSGLSYSVGTPRLQLGANLGGGVTYYYNRPGDSVDYNGNFAMSANYRATPRLNLSLSTSTAYLSQPDLATVGGSNHQNGDYLISNTTVSAAYQWSEIISSITSYNFTALYYLDNDINQNQGNISQTLAQSMLWLWKPKTTLVAEYRANTITYYGADLDQLGNYFLVGFDQIFNPRFFWNARFGAQVNFNNNPTDGQSTYVGPFMESTLRYQFATATGLSWNMRYGTEASGLNDVSQRQTFRTGLVLTHAFTSRLSGDFSMSYLCNYYDQSGVIDSYIENIVDFSVGLSYQVNRFVALQGGYQYTIDMAPENTDRAYSRNIVFVGANFSF